MLDIFKNRFEQGYRTTKYPKIEITPPGSYRGRPEINRQSDRGLIEKCVTNCPQEAIDGENVTIDLGKCVFCGTCERLSEGKFVHFSNDFELGVDSKENLITTGQIPKLENLAKAHFKKLFGRSLQLRQVSAGGCNACEADVNVLATPFFDMARFGIQFVASPRHADGLLVTGPISKNMKAAMITAYEAIPTPKIVIASGSCSISGGPFYGSEEITGGLDNILPVDLYIPGCPPHPLTTLHALLNYFK